MLKQKLPLAWLTAMCMAAVSAASFAQRVIITAPAAQTPAPNSADIELLTDLDHINIVISPGSGTGGGCPVGQQWDIGAGRCTAAVALRTESTTRTCSCSCPSGQTGSCTARQTGSYTVYGWRVPPSGAQQVSHNGSTSWGSCQTISSSCSTPPPPAPTTIVMAGNLICGSGDAYYNWSIPVTPSANVPNSVRNAIIAGYKEMPSQRCPEAGDPVSWDASYPYYVMLAGEYMQGVVRFQGQPPRSAAETANWVQNLVIKNGINESLAQMDSWCQSAANATYGAGKYTATFIRRGQPGYTGKHCRLTPR